MIMIGRVQMGAVVGRQGHLLDRPAFATGQLVACHAGEELQHLVGGLIMAHVVNLGGQPRRVSELGVFQRV